MADAQTCLGLDFGTKRIGVAVGQRLLKTANPIDTIQNRQGTPDWPALAAIIKEWQIDVIVVGIPLNMDGSEQAITQLAREFMHECEQRFHCPVFGVDERLTTREARQQIFDQGGERALKQAQIDAIAAKIILESWMQDHHDNSTS